jgi:hypothetical protein
MVANAVPEDNSTETISLRDYSGFVGKLSKAKTVRLSVNVFQQGSPVLDFDVIGFDANQYRRRRNDRFAFTSIGRPPACHAGGRGSSK